MKRGTLIVLVVILLLTILSTGCKKQPNPPVVPPKNPGNPVFNPAPYLPKAITGENVNGIAMFGMMSEGNWGRYEVVPQIGSNYNKWVNDLNNYLLPYFLEIEPGTEDFFWISGQDCLVEYESIVHPLYTVKLSFRDEEGILWAVYMRNEDNSRYTFIIRHENFYIPDRSRDKEIRQLKYEKTGSKIHSQALFYRALVGNGMNDIVEVWDDGFTKEIKCVRVYDLKLIEDEWFKMSFSSVVDLTTDDEKTTGCLFERHGVGELKEIEESPAIFNNNDYLLEQGVAEIPVGYPAVELVYRVHNTEVDINKVAGSYIDAETLESNL